MSLRSPAPSPKATVRGVPRPKVATRLPFTNSTERKSFSLLLEEEMYSKRPLSSDVRNAILSADCGFGCHSVAENWRKVRPLLLLFSESVLGMGACPELVWKRRGRRRRGRRRRG